jgi:hypothetical protein
VSALTIWIRSGLVLNDKSLRQDIASSYPLLYVFVFHTCNLCAFTFLGFHTR